MASNFARCILIFDMLICLLQALLCCRFPRALGAPCARAAGAVFCVVSLLFKFKKEHRRLEVTSAIVTAYIT